MPKIPEIIPEVEYLKRTARSTLGTSFGGPAYIIPAVCHICKDEKGPDVHGMNDDEKVAWICMPCYWARTNARRDLKRIEGTIEDDSSFIDLF